MYLILQISHAQLLQTLGGLFDGIRHLLGDSGDHKNAQDKDNQTRRAHEQQGPAAGSVALVQLILDNGQHILLIVPRPHIPSIGLKLLDKAPFGAGFRFPRLGKIEINKSSPRLVTGGNGVLHKIVPHLICGIIAVGPFHLRLDMYSVGSVGHISPKISGPVVVPGGADDIPGIFQGFLLRDQTLLIFFILRLKHPDHALHLALNHLIQFVLLCSN